MKVNSAEYSTYLSKRLNSLPEVLIEELLRIKNFKIHPETVSYEFEIHSNLSIVLYPMDSELNQVLDSKIVDNKYFIGHYKVALALEDELLLDNDNFQDYFDESHDSVIITLIEWFAECWNKASVSSYDLPTYISEHDSNIIFDLSLNKWLNQDYQNDVNNCIKSESKEPNVIDVWIDPDFLKDINNEDGS